MRLRLSWIGAFFGAMLLLPQLARADEPCLCVHGVDETPWSVLVAAFEEAQLELASARLESPAPERPRTILWCISADDPRCSQRQPGNEAPSGTALRSTPVGALVTSIPVGRSTGTQVVWPAEAGQPSEGVRHRLDRPPRY